MSEEKWVDDGIAIRVTYTDGKAATKQMWTRRPLSKITVREWLSWLREFVGGKKLTHREIAATSSPNLFELDRNAGFYITAVVTLWGLGFVVVISGIRAILKNRMPLTRSKVATGNHASRIGWFLVAVGLSLLFCLTIPLTLILLP